MRRRILSGFILLSLLVLPAVSRGEEPRGRARTWDIEPLVGFSVIDTGFDRKLFNYELNSSRAFNVPPTRADKLDSTIPTAGLRVGYSFTRYFGLELSGAVGETQVGDNTQVTLEENVTIPDFNLRQQILAQQTATAPQILAAYDKLDFGYSTGNLVGVFKFNNYTTSKWVFYGSLGGGYFALNPDTAAWQDCNASLVFDPSMPRYNGDPDDPFDPDLFADNPEQLREESGCDSAFQVANQFGTVINPNTGLRERNIVLGTRMQDADPQIAPGFCSSPGGPGGSEQQDLDTGQISCDGVPQWITAPGTLDPLTRNEFIRGADRSGIRGFEDFFYSAGFGVRVHLKPRHVLRIDTKRHFIETRNKNINEFTFGWSFVLGRGRPDVAASPPPAPPGGDEVPPPAEAEDDSGLS